MKQILNNQLLLLLIRLTLGVFFLLASIGKIADPALFAREIANYRLMPELIVNLMAIAIPWIELACAVFLIAGIRMKANAAIIAGMLVVFIGAIGSAMARGLNINCGCISSQVSIVGWGKIFEDLALLAGALILFFSNNRSFTLERIIVNDDRESKNPLF